VIEIDLRLIAKLIATLLNVEKMDWSELDSGGCIATYELV
jgi:hypothetical protein